MWYCFKKKEMKGSNLNSDKKIWLSAKETFWDQIAYEKLIIGEFLLARLHAF
jgi:hypothetical protein